MGRFTLGLEERVNSEIRPDRPWSDSGFGVGGPQPHEGEQTEQRERPQTCHLPDRHHPAGKVRAVVGAWGASPPPKSRTVSNDGFRNSGRRRLSPPPCALPQGRRRPAATGRPHVGLAQEGS